MSRRMGLFIMLVVAVSFSCSSALLTKERAYLDKVNDSSLTFTVLAESGDAAWSRANGFVTTYSSMNVATKNDYLIQTDAPSVSVNGGLKYGYSITRTRTVTGWQFSVNCTSNNVFTAAPATKNAHILALYILTGELPFPKLISK